MMIVLLLLTLPITTALPTGPTISITTASPAGNDFNLTLPTQVTQDVLNSLKTAEKIDLHTALIIQQASFPKLSGVENLLDHQEAVKGTARTWRSHVRSKLFSVNDAILAFSYEFDAFYDSLMNYTDKLETEDGKVTFDALLEELCTTIRQKHDDTVSAGQTLTEFLHRMIQHEGIINKDRDLVLETTTANNQAVQDIRRRIEAIGRTIQEREDSLQFTDGVIGFLRIIPVVGRIVQATASLLWRNGAINNLRQLFDERNQLIIELHNINSRVALADVVARDVDTLVSHIKTVVNATEELNSAWSQLDRDFKSVRDTVGGVERLAASVRAKLVTIVKIKLKTAKDQWQSLAESAKVIKNQHLIPQSRYY